MAKARKPVKNKVEQVSKHINTLELLKQKRKLLDEISKTKLSDVLEKKEVTITLVINPNVDSEGYGRHKVEVKNNPSLTTLLRNQIGSNVCNSILPVFYDAATIKLLKESKMIARY